MKRRMGWLLTLVLVLLTTGGASSGEVEIATLQVQPYDFRNDLDEGEYRYYDLTEEQTRALTKGSFQVHGMVPVSDDLLVMVGAYSYNELKMEESRTLGHEVLPERTEAYAVAIDAEGKRVWSFRFGDPRAYNDFERVSLLPDGRLLMKYRNQIGEFGSHLFVVNQQGEVEEMLPTGKLREAGRMEMLRWYPEPEGFLGGGYHMDWDGSIGFMTAEDEIIFVRPDYTVAWRLQDEALLGASMYDDARRMDDGFLFYGGRYREDTGSSLMVVKVTDEGELAWVFTGDPLAEVGIGDAWQTSDGGVLMCATGDPMAPTPYIPENKGALAKLDAEGNHVWTRAYEAEGFAELYAMHPYGEGFLVAGLSEGYEENRLMYVDEAGEPLGIARLALQFQTSEAQLAWMRLVAAPEGGVYVYGTEMELIEDETEGTFYYWGEPFFVKVEEGFFGA